MKEEDGEEIGEGGWGWNGRMKEKDGGDGDGGGEGLGASQGEDDGGARGEDGGPGANLLYIITNCILSLPGLPAPRPLQYNPPEGDVPQPDEIHPRRAVPNRREPQNLQGTCLGPLPLTYPSRSSEMPSVSTAAMPVSSC